jgi:mono/diheme cytochrome c family protein
MKRALALLSFSVMGVHAASIAADSARGAKLFETLRCVQCHSVNGRGGTAAPDLGRLVDRSFTPATLAATMWNHAPAMWASMHQRDIRAGDLDAQAAADLFAYFYSARFFDKLGDASRGKQAFTERGCASCHGLTNFVRPLVKPVAQWDVLRDPVALAEAMWNHRARMAEEAGAKRVRWPELSNQDLADILVYLRNLPSPPSKPAVFSIGDGSDGEAVFNSKGCSGCHRSGSALERRIKGETLTDIAAAMWDHAPRMEAAGAAPVKLEPGEMRQLLSYLWAKQFFEDSGNPAAGRRVFVAKRCATCHEDASSGAPRLAGSGRVFSGASMVSSLWHHGPRMLDQMNAKSIPWPRFEGTQMSNLIAYLNGGYGRRP